MHNQFEDLAISDIPRQAIHLEWGDLSNMAHRIFFRLLGRVVSFENDRCDYYDWGFTLIDDELSQAELETLFMAIEADVYDRESNDFDGNPIRELSQSLSCKLISLLLPFQTEESHADDYGVWFISKFVHEGEEAAS